MAIPLHRASAFELSPEQSPFAQKEADIGAPITRSAPTTQISLRHEIRKYAWPSIAVMTRIVPILTFARDTSCAL
jgi:hypothetical protein